MNRKKHTLFLMSWSTLLVFGFIIIAGCKPEPPSGEYSLQIRRNRYTEAFSFISAKQTERFQRSEIRFHDTQQPDLNGSLTPVFENGEYVGTKTTPIGWTVRIFDEVKAPFPPKTMTGKTVIYFDLGGSVVDSKKMD